jgi:signal transduction histidine kinase
LNFISHPTLSLQRDGNSLKGRIQFSIIGVVLVTLLVVGSGTVFYIISNYRSSYQKGLIDKINSVSLEMEPVFEKANFPFDLEIDYLNYELTRISDVFQTDINLYDFSGNLVSTSRPEVYEKGLMAPIMNNLAFQAFSNYHSSNFLQQEKIGKMKYLSAYVPVYNRNGQKTGYLNIPYFTREKAFRQEITTFILAFVNIYVFLLLTSILVAYFISSRITLPLRLIREHLQGVQFGKNPTPIRYRSDDELGILVAEYNRKVDELAESAELLARSERESAWREMARQIAHEIKNPLTPMKLNIQFLQRTDPKTVDNYPEILNRVTRTIIEQIDNLSAIATEFSNFAKIPRAHNERFNLSKRIEEIIPLFDYSGDCKIKTHFKGAESLEVFADKEQFSRAIINLVKNAIQAVPDNRNGEITIAVENHTTNAVVSVADNGKGISEELLTSIFVPNFTTKTSGTGLGLAITKGIVENFGGEIWFETELDQGTTFFIRIPVLK